MRGAQGGGVGGEREVPLIRPLRGHLPPRGRLGEAGGHIGPPVRRQGRLRGRFWKERDMVILAVALAAVALGVAGAALALALAGTVWKERRAAGSAGAAEEPEEERRKAEEAEKRMREGLDHLMDFDPFRKGEGE